MRGMGNTANRATCHEMRRNTAPTTTTVVLTCAKVVGTLVQEPLELIDVIVKDGEDVSLLPFVKPRHALLLNVVEGVQPQLVLHRLGQVPPQDTVEVFEQRLNPHMRKVSTDKATSWCHGSTRPTFASVDSSRSTTTSTAKPMSSGGARSQNLLNTEQNAAKRTVPRCGFM